MNRTRRSANKRRRRRKGEYRALVGRRSIPLMKYIVKFREGKMERDGGLRDVREGTVRKVAASRRNEQKRE